MLHAAIPSRRTRAFFLLVVSSAALSACGGGAGGTDSAMGTIGTTSNTPTIAPTTSPTVSPTTTTTPTTTVTPGSPTTTTTDVPTTPATTVPDPTGGTGSMPVIAPAPTPTPVTTPVSTPVAMPVTTPVVTPVVPPVAMPVVTTLMPTVSVNKLVAQAVGSATMDVMPTAELVPTGDGAFRTECTVAKMSFDDPIVYPGQAGLSHLHTFFGNTATFAGSTPDSIRNSGNSTCRGGIANRSAYWVPTIIDTRDGTPIAADGVGVYYKNGLFDGSLVHALPIGLRMIAGNPAGAVARTDNDPFSYRFKCIGGPNNENDKYGSEIPNCDVGATIIQEVMFPQCWDGVNLDSPDHKSHMSYTVLVPIPGDTRGWTMPACPSTHPVILPSITFNVSYTVTEKDAPLRWRLSSDNYDTKLPGGYSSHGDWFNGWKSDISDTFVKNCIQGDKDCHAHLLGDGRMIF